MFVPESQGGQLGSLAPYYMCTRIKAQRASAPPTVVTVQNGGPCHPSGKAEAAQAANEAAKAVAEAALTEAATFPNISAKSR